MYHGFAIKYTVPEPSTYCVYAVFKKPVWLPEGEAIVCLPHFSVFKSLKSLSLKKPLIVFAEVVFVVVIAHIVVIARSRAPARSRLYAVCLELLAMLHFHTDKHPTYFSTQKFRLFVILPELKVLTLRI